MLVPASRFAMVAALLTFLAPAAPRTVSQHVDPDATDDDAWVTRALADPASDRGWGQSCQDDWGDNRVSVCEVREFPYPTNAPVAFDGGPNSGASVIGWDRNEVRVLYRVRARARSLDDAKALARSIRLERSGGWLRATGPATTEDAWWAVEARLWVPHASDVGLKAMNGPLSVRDVHGAMDVATVNGPLALIRLGGAVVAHTQNGPLHVELAGARWDGTGLDASTTNGPVNLELPRDYSAKIETGTLNGPSTIEYAPSRRGARLRGHVTTSLGSGGAPVRVVTDNGPYRITAR